MSESVLFQDPQLAFEHAARQDVDDAIAVIVAGLGELLDELRQELGSVRAELAALKAANAPLGGSPSTS